MIIVETAIYRVFVMIYRVKPSPNPIEITGTDIVNTESHQNK
ncbi:hypothetical protein [Nostoc sp. C052]|nr:hypothetical protein [Nostoc sp. C052]